MSDYRIEIDIEHVLELVETEPNIGKTTHLCPLSVEWPNGCVDWVCYVTSYACPDGDGQASRSCPLRHGNVVIAKKEPKHD